MNSSQYAEGLAILRTIYRYTKSNLTYDRFIDSLKRNWDGSYIPQKDFEEYVQNLAVTKKMFISIPFKSASDFDAILKKIGSMTPKGKFPDRRMISSAFIDPKNFKASFFDVVSLSASATKEVVKTTAKVAAGAGSLILIAKLIGVGIGAYLLVKSFGQKKGYIK
jgi:hypothetical protein